MKITSSLSTNYSDANADKLVSAFRDFKRIADAMYVENPTHWFMFSNGVSHTEGHIETLDDYRASKSIKQDAYKNGREQVVDDVKDIFEFLNGRNKV